MFQQLINAIMMFFVELVDAVPDLMLTVVKFSKLDTFQPVELRGKLKNT